MSEVDIYESLDDSVLMQVEGGVIPLAIIALWGSGFCAGFAGGIAVGLSHLNHNR